LNSIFGTCSRSLPQVHYTSLFLGIIGAGGCFSGANPGYTAHELTHHVRITQAKFILASLKTLDIAVAAADSCGIPQSKIFVLNLHHEEIPEGQQSWNQLLKCGEQEWERVDDPDNTPAAYVSTSGTSGLPKAAIIPHSYFVSQAEFQVKTAAVRYKLSTLIAIPPFHVFTIPVQHALPLRKGTPTYIMPRFEAPGFLDAIETFRISHTIVVPPILMALANCSESSQLKSLKRIYVGGSCATDGMQQQLYAKLSPSARIEQVYGMTETGWSTTWHDRNPETTGSVGRPLPGTELR
jgi:acyl-CoA synthetase (AMP-forming)/AMP-acid ligase II